MEWGFFLPLPWQCPSDYFGSTQSKSQLRVVRASDGVCMVSGYIVAQPGTDGLSNELKPSSGGDMNCWRVYRGDEYQGLATNYVDGEEYVIY